KLLMNGVEVLLDDRKGRPGVKFNDRDLIGIPLRITVGKGAADGIVEYSTRAEMENKEISVDEAIETVIEKVEKEVKKPSFLYRYKYLKTHLLCLYFFGNL